MCLCMASPLYVTVSTWSGYQPIKGGGVTVGALFRVTATLFL